MLQHYLFIGFSAIYYSQSTANPQRRPHLFASLALQEAEGSRTVAHIRSAKAAEIPLWLDEQMQRHVSDEVRHAQIFTKAVEREGYFIDLDSEAAQHSLSSVGESSMRRYHQVDDLAAAPLPHLLASVLLAEELGVRGFRCILKALPDHLIATRAALESVLKDEERHVQYLTDALRYFRATSVVEAYRRDIESKMFKDLGKVVEFVTKPATERPSLVQPGQKPELSLV
ncbi:MULTISPECIES: ferritin-like domain-containing protein [Cyanophyceae]|uniref:Ferritin-like domain-containing protein n=1 Tax=Leptolyngbya subtilissima DQ-A4 TaxID=2933933 RepID=A0ABV0K3V3_9CYAN|nr:ferritin-like domain-containing protein [Nodosilinea sp. FACHB-141]MBD2113333.1 ferritin-like domain-containing protein [Nodosilinea sp. FACHB-141]